jgi:hypothetical protein
MRYALKILSVLCFERVAISSAFKPALLPDEAQYGGFEGESLFSR